jgi:hypothetical protein
MNTKTSIQFIIKQNIHAGKQASNIQVLRTEKYDSNTFILLSIHQKSAALNISYHE